MSERFIEVNIHEGGGHVCTGTIDLESVILFKKQHAGWIKVLLSTSGLWEIEVGYDAFKKLHSDYHASKLPTVISPSHWIDPTVNVKSTLTTTSTGEWTLAEINEERKKMLEENARQRLAKKKPKKR